MKATGIVRRIDDLGRIVIPKETYFQWITIVMKKLFQRILLNRL